jgi:RHS repeat-associated protein
LPVGASYSIVYNKRNRPATLRLNGTAVASYFYSAEEQLVSRSLVSPLTPAGFTHYIYDLEGHLIAEATGATAATAVTTREYLWLGDMPVMVIDGVNTANPVPGAVHVDHLMRPIRITNAAKASTWDATWLPWGGAHVTTGATAMSLRFPGQYFLIEQGLAYNWHRMYDQSTGRYTQADPLGFPDGPSRYAYAGNSPLMNVDPEGLYVLFTVTDGTATLGPFGGTYGKGTLWDITENGVCVRKFTTYGWAVGAYIGVGQSFGYYPGTAEGFSGAAVGFTGGYGPGSLGVFYSGKAPGALGGIGTGADLGVYVGVTNTTLDDPPCDCNSSSGW